LLNCFTCHYLLLLGLLLTGHGLLRTLALAGVASRALSSGGEATAMAQASVGADLDQAADVAVDLSAKVSFYLAVAIKHFAEMGDLGLGEITHLLAGVHACLLKQLKDVVLTNAIEQGERILRRLLSGKVDTCDTCHLVRFPFLRQPISPVAACASCSR